MPFKYRVCVNEHSRAGMHSNGLYCCNAYAMIR